MNFHPLFFAKYKKKKQKEPAVHHTQLTINSNTHTIIKKDNSLQIAYKFHDKIHFESWIKAEKLKLSLLNTKNCIQTESNIPN